jgi:hypothetical protein
LKENFSDYRKRRAAAYLRCKNKRRRLAEEYDAIENLPEFPDNREEVVEAEEVAEAEDEEALNCSDVDPSSSFN